MYAQSAGPHCGDDAVQKAWETFPEERSNMMSSFDEPALWSRRRCSDYGKQSLIPTAGAVRNNRWYGIDDVGLRRRGRITACSIACSTRWGRQPARETPAKSPRLQSNIRAARRPAILAVIDLRLGKEIDAAAVLRPMLDDDGHESYQLRHARWIVAKSWKRSRRPKSGREVIELACVPTSKISTISFSTARRRG